MKNNKKVTGLYNKIAPMFDSIKANQLSFSYFPDGSRLTCGQSIALYLQMSAALGREAGEEARKRGEDYSVTYD